MRLALSLWVWVDTQLDLETFVNIVFNLGNAWGVGGGGEGDDWILPSYHEDGFIAVKFLPT